MNVAVNFPVSIQASVIICLIHLAIVSLNTFLYGSNVVIKALNLKILVIELEGI